MDTKDMHSV